MPITRLRCIDKYDENYTISVILCPNIEIVLPTPPLLSTICKKSKRWKDHGIKIYSLSL